MMDAYLLGILGYLTREETVLPTPKASEYALGDPEPETEEDPEVEFPMETIKEEPDATLS